MCKVIWAVVLACLCLLSGAARAEDLSWRPTVELGRLLVEDATWSGKAIDERAWATHLEDYGAWEPLTCSRKMLLLYAATDVLDTLCSHFINTNIYSTWPPSEWPTNGWCMWVPTSLTVAAGTTLSWSYYGSIESWVESEWRNQSDMWRDITNMVILLRYTAPSNYAFKRDMLLIEEYNGSIQSSPGTTTNYLCLSGSPPSGAVPVLQAPSLCRSSNTLSDITIGECSGEVSLHGYWVNYGWYSVGTNVVWDWGAGSMEYQGICQLAFAVSLCPVGIGWACPLIGNEHSFIVYKNDDTVSIGSEVCGLTNGADLCGMVVGGGTNVPYHGSYSAGEYSQTNAVLWCRTDYLDSDDILPVSCIKGDIRGMHVDYCDDPSACGGAGPPCLDYIYQYKYAYGAAVTRSFSFIIGWDFSYK